MHQLADILLEEITDRNLARRIVTRVHGLMAIPGALDNAPDILENAAPD